MPRRVRGRKNTTRLPTQNPEEPLFYRSSGTVVLLYPCEITMIPVHGITTVGAGLAVPIGTFLRRRAQQAAPLRFGCRNDKPRCYPHHSRKSPLSFVSL